jgi:M6 family metalloprotease-like protein
MIRDVVFGDLDKYYKEVSYGLVSITGDIADRWYQTQTPLNDLHLQEWSYNETEMHLFEREALGIASKAVNLRNYDFVILVAAGEVWPHATCDFGLSTDHGARPVRGIVVNEYAPMGTYAHELGHVLPTKYEPRHNCGLPDLYSYDADKRGQDPNIFVGPWDIMGSSNPPKHFSAWSKIMLGWITPEVVPVGSSIALPITLKPIEESTGTRALVAQISESKFLVVEVRRQIGYDKSLPSEGVLVYSVDMSKGNGEGPVQVFNSHPETQSLDDAPYKQGAFLADPAKGVYVAVAYSHGVGYFVLSTGSGESLNTSLPFYMTIAICLPWTGSILAKNLQKTGFRTETTNHQ